VLERFGFSVMPFTREISIENQLKWDFIDEEVDKIKHVIEQRLSAVLVAAAGSGKTQAIRNLCAKLPQARYRVHYVKVTGLSKRDMCSEICRALSLKPAGTYPAMVRAIQERIDGLASSDGLRSLIIFDEAHDMRPDVLSMLRILTNFEMDSRLAVSLLLVGQAHLKRLLHHEDLLDIRQRLSHCGELRLLSTQETSQYLEHRTTVAGARKNPFLPEASQAVYEIARGNMRAIDAISLKALEIADRNERDRVESTHVLAARGELWI
jgi:general secretion pathway protein A